MESVGTMNQCVSLVLLRRFCIPKEALNLGCNS